MRVVDVVQKLMPTQIVWEVFNCCSLMVFAISQNYPNAFADQTSFNIVCSSVSVLNITIRSIPGTTVASWTSDHLPQGVHSFIFESVALPGGTYFITASDGSN